MAKPSVPRKVGKKEVLKVIKENQPISIYQLGKILNYASYSGIYDYVKELEDKGLIKTKIRLGKNNRAKRIINIEDKNGT